tara:strand:+ start:247 stop:537 length:291 start_codon:yes stop_codon:yes gene_type:complete
VKKSILLFLLFHIGVGIISPTIDILNDNSIEESIAYINSDRDIETEEEELDKNVEFFYYSEKASSKVNISLSTFWRQDLYQDIFLNRLVTPPKTNI